MIPEAAKLLCEIENKELKLVCRLARDFSNRKGVFSRVVLSAKDGKVSLYATNGISGLRWDFLIARAQKDFAGAIPLKILEVASKQGDALAVYDFNIGELMVTVHNTNTAYYPDSVVTVEDFPEFPEGSGDPIDFDGYSLDFYGAFYNVLYACESSARNGLDGVFFAHRGAGFYLFATDSIRLAMTKLNLNKFRMSYSVTRELESGMFFPGDFIRATLSLLKHVTCDLDDQRLTLSVYEDLVMLRHKRFQAFSYTEQKDAPEIASSIMGQDVKSWPQAVFPWGNLKNRLRRLSDFRTTATGVDVYVEFQFSGAVAKIVLQDAVAGRIETMTPVAVKDFPDFECNLLLFEDFVTAGVASLQEYGVEEIAISQETPDSPLRIDGVNCVHLLMPGRIEPKEYLEEDEDYEHH